MPITKYMSLSRFADLVEKGLYISCASEFDDWWEAALAYCDQDGIPRADDNFEMLKTHLAWIYVSCWTKRSSESYPMWRLYGGWSEKTPAETPAVALSLELNDLSTCFDQYHGDKFAKKCSIDYLNPNSKSDRERSMSSIGLGKGGNHPDFQVMISMLYLTQ